ncbi:MAG: ABC transporter permease [Cytophagales bacterium]|nr:ABC transporter permease [Cytophagales bacterium]
MRNILAKFRYYFQSIWTNRLRVLLTVFMMATGICCLVGMVTTMEGLESTVEGVFEAQSSTVFRLVAQEPSSLFRDRGKRRGGRALRYDETKRFVDEMGKYSDVFASLKAYGADVPLVNLENTQILPGKYSILGGDEKTLLVESVSLIQGRNFSIQEVRTGRKVILIGEGVRDGLFVENNVVGKVIRVQNKDCTIIGVLSSEGAETDVHNTVVMPFLVAKTLQTKLNYSASVLVSEKNKLEELMRKAALVMREIRRDRPGKEDSFGLVSKDMYLSKFRQLMGYISIGVGSISFITLLCASVGLANIMLVYVKERVREIGLRKAVGATPTMIRNQFLVEAIIICQMGGILGIFMGFLCGMITTNLIDIPFFLPWKSILLGIGLSFLVGCLSGYFPAYLASRQDPISSLRHE